MTTLSCSDVTVVVPAFRAASTIERTLASLDAQSIGRPRVVVVDDGSPDDTATVAVAAGAEVVRRENGGPGAARNTGVEVATSAILCFCDADDVWPVDRLESDLAYLGTHPTVDALLGRTRLDADDDALLEGMHFDGPDRAALLPLFGAVTVRRAAFDLIGPVDESMANYEDYDWFLLARERQVRLVTHDRVVLHRRMHRGSTSQTNPGTTRDLLSTLQRSLRRRREGGHHGPLPSLRDLRSGDAP